MSAESKGDPELKAVKPIAQCIFGCWSSSPWKGREEIHARLLIIREWGENSVYVMRLQKFSVRQ